MRPNKIAVTFIPVIIKVVGCLCVTKALTGLFIHGSERCLFSLQQESGSCGVLQNDSSDTGAEWGRAFPKMTLLPLHFVARVDSSTDFEL